MFGSVINPADKSKVHVFVEFTFYWREIDNKQRRKILDGNCATHNK